MRNVLAALVAVLLVLTGCSLQSQATGQTTGQTTGQATGLGRRIKTSGCRVDGALQDPACTPGAIIADATKAQICQSGYARNVRDVPDFEKNQVYEEYGVTHHTTGEYEVDHLVSLELGGSNDIANLWPEAASPKPGFHEKDQVENYLHDQVCAGKIGLAQAQHDIATNWLAIYRQMPQR
jgi:hypothetical protein